MKTLLTAFRAGGGVRRFHTARVICENTVAEHTFGVMCILDAIYDGFVPSDVMRAALFHDIAEHKYGDIPGPVKRFLDNDRLREAEAQYETSIGVHVTLGGREQRILKFADNVDGFLFCHDEYMRGNKTLIKIASNYLEYINDGANTVAEYGIAMDIFARINTIATLMNQKFGDMK